MQLVIAYRENHVTMSTFVIFISFSAVFGLSRLLFSELFSLGKQLNHMTHLLQECTGIFPPKSKDIIQIAAATSGLHVLGLKTSSETETTSVLLSP